MADRLLYLASLVTFTFGALTLSLLTASYWGARWRRERHDDCKRTVFPVFTLFCAAAFVLNLLMQVVLLPGASPRLAIAMMVTRSLVVGVLPPLMLHLVYEIEASELPARRLWHWVLLVFYGAGISSALVKGLSESGFLRTAWGEPLDRAPGVILAAVAAAGLLLQVLSRRQPRGGERAHRRWIGGLLLVMLICAAVNLADPGPVVGLMPDYALLLFFSVSLYYRERLAFIDVLVKRGAFFAIGLVMLTLFFAVAARAVSLESSESSPWIAALLLLPFWLIGPWIYKQVERAVDRVWLRRPYSPVDAERRFLRDLQAAATEEHLRSRAASSLSLIFHAPAEVEFEPSAASHPNTAGHDGMLAELERDGTPLGAIRMGARSDSIPFLSDDRRLLQSLAGALGIVLDNVRFRIDRLRQEEREQQLRWLASRAELKALRAQINPHFLFNALNSIAGLIRTEPRLADETIEQLAQVFRYTLRKPDNEWVPLGEEMEFVAAYLRVEKARFGDRLQLAFELDEAAEGSLIPAMTIQPLVENAIKHGVRAMTEGGAVSLRTQVELGNLVVVVQDSGPGFPPGFSLDGDGEGHGLRNVVERLRGYYGESARLSWESGRGGTRVELRLPQSHCVSSGRDRAAC